MYPQSFSPVQQVDFALLLVFSFAGVVVLALTLITLWFIYRFRHEKNPEPTDIQGNTRLEIAWTLVPFLLVMGLFYFGWTGYKALRTVPDNALPVQVTAKMFSWTFTYQNGKHSSELVVPTDRPVLLKIRSADVIHSFFAPAFRVKMDAVPGMENYTWFKAERDGEYEIYCAEYCGTGHSVMLSKIKTMPEKDFAAWLDTKEPLKGADAGHALMEAQGCFSCHNMNGDNSMAPALPGLYGSTLTITVDGKEKQVVADERYLKESIINPGWRTIKGYDNTMPPYSDLTPEELLQILQYLKSIGKDSPAGAGGAHRGHDGHGTQ